MKNILLISSLGGHLEQLLSLKSVIDQYEVTIVTEKNLSTKKLKDTYENILYVPFVSRKNLFRFIFNYVKILFISIKILIKVKPEIIISTGAGCVLPICILGRISGKKIIFIETFSRINSKTITGRICYYFAHVFVVQWEQLKELYPRAIYLGPIY